MSFSFFLKKISIFFYRLGIYGIKQLSKGLKENTSLDTLSLVGCYIRPQGAQTLAHALNINTTLAELNLSNNGIRDRGLSYLISATGITENSVTIFF